MKNKTVLKTEKKIAEKFMENMNIHFKNSNNAISGSFIEILLEHEIEPSELETYNNNKKLARYITDYFFWLYSNDKKEAEEEKLDEKEYPDTVIIPKYIYPNDIPIEFSISSSLLQNGKLILDSDKTLQRLKYVLDLELQRNPGKIEDYYNRENISGYFENINDFDSYPSQIILFGNFSNMTKNNTELKTKIISNINELAFSIFQKMEKSNLILKMKDDDINTFKKSQKERQELKQTQWNNIVSSEWNNADKKKYETYIQPYMLLVDNKTYLAQLTDTLEKAISISKTWKEDGYNIGYNPEPYVGNLEYIMYIYGNIKYRVEGENNNLDIKIASFVSDLGELRFLSLLKI